MEGHCPYPDPTKVLALDDHLDAPEVQTGAQVVSVSSGTSDQDGGLVVERLLRSVALPGNGQGHHDADDVTLGEQGVYDGVLSMCPDRRYKMRLECLWVDHDLRGHCLVTST